MDKNTKYRSLLMNTNLILTILFILFYFVDGALTYIGLINGFTDKNPLYNGDSALFFNIVIHGGVIYIYLVLYYFLKDIVNQSKIYLGFILFVTIFFMYIAYWNLRILLF